MAGGAFYGLNKKTNRVLTSGSVSQQQAMRDLIVAAGAIKREAVDRLPDHTLTGLTRSLGDAGYVILWSDHVQVLGKPWR